MGSWAVLGVCLYKDMLWGVVLGIGAFQVHAALTSTRGAGDKAQQKKTQ